MTETMAGPGDLQFRQTIRPHEQAFSDARIPDIAPDEIKSGDGVDLERATQDAYEQARSIDERLVYPHPRDSNVEFIIDPPKPETQTPRDQIWDDSYAERIQQQRAAVALEAEARATERQQAQAIGWNGQAIVGVRDFVEQKGWNAQIGGTQNNEWDLAA